MKLHKARTKAGKRVCGAVAWTSFVGIYLLSGVLEEYIWLLSLVPVLVFGLAWGAWAAGVINEGGTEFVLQRTRQSYYK